jgi:hypothetical protein
VSLSFTRCIVHFSPGACHGRGHGAADATFVPRAAAADRRPDRLDHIYIALMVVVEFRS